MSDWEQKGLTVEFALNSHDAGKRHLRCTELARTGTLQVLRKTALLPLPGGVRREKVIPKDQADFLIHASAVSHETL